ncbi:large subunit ribosomal protein L44e [Cladophialophora yegresii CBS 114405]|uniref:Large subunit ribosomal protein L44e n=3 Tax=leotiomyceta TaxID=716546 RepID=W9VLB8_9EURO|nr:large subunit ribosomal protein L44e [Cladophialophora yegresii CBS 114405]EXJ56487.1 large subunit ribosomal protein L44e [Cladophialophora yegresii CBS 114405]
MVSHPVSTPLKFAQYPGRQHERDEKRSGKGRQEMEVAYLEEMSGAEGGFRRGRVKNLCEDFGVLDAVNVPKTRRTYCKGKTCKKHTQHKVTQYKAGKASLFAQGKRRYDRKQSGYGGQTKPVFHKKAKTTKKVVLRLECTSCKTKAQLSLKRCKHFELGGDKKTKGAALVF